MKRKKKGKSKKRVEEETTEEKDSVEIEVDVESAPPPPKPAMEPEKSKTLADPTAGVFVPGKTRIAKPTSIRKKELNAEGGPGPRRAVMPVMVVDEEDGKTRNKSPKLFKLIRESLDNSKGLSSSCLKDFDDAGVDEFVARLYQMETTAGEVIMKQGDIGDAFYVVEKGKYEQHYKFTQGEEDEFDDGKVEDTINQTRGGFFGEWFLLYESPSNCTVTSVRDGVLWVLTRRDYLLVTKHLAERQQLRKIQFLNSVDLFASNLSEAEIQQLADALEYRSFSRGNVVLEPGPALKEMIFVAKGAIDMYAPSNDQPIASLYEGETFGEFALLEPCPVEYKLQVTTRKAAVLSLNLEECEGLLGPIREVVTDRWRDAFVTKMTNMKEMNEIKAKENDMLNATIAQTKQGLTTILQRPATKSPSPDAVADPQTAQPGKSSPPGPDQAWEEAPPLLPHVKFSDFSPITCLGQGSFGKVFLVRDDGKETNYILDRSDQEAPKYFALKIMARSFIVNNGWEEKADNETSAMAELSYHENSPFILQLYHSWACPKNIYFLLEYGEGGDLYGMMKIQNDYCFTENAARYYIASVVNAFDIFHQRGICFRDLKPENLILNRHGHLKLADLGLAKKTLRTYTVCGTPDYMAPEILRGRGHDKSVDWWALGVLVYELHTGLTPFYGDTPDKIYELILAHVPPFRFTDETMSKSAKDLANKLLEPKRTRRLGNVKTGADGIRKHKYFSKFNWESHGKLETVPPIKPDFVEINDRDGTVKTDPIEDDNSKWVPKVNTSLSETPAL